MVKNKLNKLRNKNILKFNCSKSALSILLIVIFLLFKTGIIYLYEVEYVIEK